MKKFILLLGIALGINANAAPLLCDIEASAPCLMDTGEELFSITDTDGLDDDITSFIIGRNAGFSNAVGIYNPNNPASTLELWDGSVAPGFGSGIVLNYFAPTSTYSIDGGGGFINLSSADFGMYVNNGSDTWYSQTALNSDGFDHLLTFSTEGQGGTTNGFDWVLAWEDLPNGGDKDFNDVVYGCIDCRPAAVPAPGTLLLMGLGLLGLRRWVGA